MQSGAGHLSDHNKVIINNYSYALFIRMLHWYCGHFQMIHESLKFKVVAHLILGLASIRLGSILNIHSNTAHVYAFIVN